MSPEHLEKMREGRKKGGGRKKRVVGNIEALKNSTPPPYNGVIKKIEGGSFSAAIKLKCLECSGYLKEEVKHCPIFNCALWGFRPYRKRDGEK